MLIGRYAALLDANVLHPAFVRGALLWLAEERLFRPCWSADILAEWRRSVQRRFPETTDERLAAQQQLMEESFPDAEITGYARFIEALDLPDKDDRHVLAAAIVGQCAGIVTSNTKHFPSEIGEEYRIEVMHPDDFIVNVIDLNPSRAIAACKRHRAAMTKTNPTPAEFLERYERSGLIQAQQRLSAHMDLL